jgi:hypothetical protein
MTGAYVDKFAGIAPKKIPVGESLLLLGGFGVAGGLDRIIRAYLPAAWRKWGSVGVGLLLAYLWKNIGFFQRLLGESGTTALAIGSVAMPLENALAITSRINSMIARLAPTGAGLAGAPRVQTAAPAAAKAAAPAREEVFASPVPEKLRSILERY